MSEQLLDFIQALIGIFIVFGAIGVGCAIYEIIVITFQHRKRKKVRRPELKKYCKWNN